MAEGLKIQDKRLNDLLEEFDRTAQNNGYSSSEGSFDEPADARKEYEDAKEKLIKAINRKLVIIRNKRGITQ